MRPLSVSEERTTSTSLTWTCTQPAWWWMGLLPPRPLQQSFEWGTYAEAYHALMKSGSMYPSDWGNDLMVDWFVGSSMLLFWDLKPDNSISMAYLSPRCLGTVKSGLRGAMPMPATTTLIAMPSMTTCGWSTRLVLHGSLWLKCLMFRWQLQEVLMRDPRDPRILVDVYAMNRWWPLPTKFPVAYMISTAHSWAKDHWVAAFFWGLETSILTWLPRWIWHTKACSKCARRAFSTAHKCYRDHSCRPVDVKLSNS